MSLTTYNKKRDFKNTQEPSGKKGDSKNLSFVVQRHDASHLHYDFRLELDGLLKSWAVPKGPSLNPRDKRLAVMVEDHPIAYGKFEGTIPKGNYGAGTVEIWDKGNYEPEKANTKSAAAELRKGLKAGSLKITLHGEKLKGGFALVQLKDGKEKNWLLIKHRDEFAQEDFEIEKVETIAPEKRASKFKRFSMDGVEGKKLTTFIKPMLAKVVDQPFDNVDWIYEIKWDGYRAIAELKSKEIKLYSRNGLSFYEAYPEIVEELKKIETDVVIDGEIVVLDENDKPSFQHLQHYSENRSHPIHYYVFDCLSYAGKDISDLPLVERKEILKTLIPKNSIIKFSDHIHETGINFYNEIVKLGGLEGMMAKRSNSIYQPGRRTDDWLKVKNNQTQEAIIAGYTAPQGSRKYFGALVLGMYINEKLTYIGHAGTGFTEKLLKELHTTFQPLIKETSPFSSIKVPVNAPVTWLEPSLSCEVKFTGLTEEGIMRHPVFMKIKTNKPTKTVKTPAKKKTSSAVSVKKSKKENVEVVKLGEHEVKLTNQQKIYWPEEGYTKGDVIEYYNKVAPYILPYLKDRPQSLKRNPNGLTDKGFYHKDAGDTAPEWVKSIEIYSESADKNIDYILCNDKATLTYLNNLGCIEINPWNSTIHKPDHPDYLIIDIDPSEKNTFEEVIDVALAVKDVLDRAGAKSYCKTSGATGIHVYIPLHAQYTYEQARPFAELVAELSREQLPSISTLERPLNKRKNRIYIDHLQNKRGQTLAAVYSLRPVPGASISTPLAWKEVKHGLSPLDFTLATIHKRLEKTGDIFSGVLKEKTNILKCIKALEAN